MNTRIKLNQTNSTFQAVQATREEKLERVTALVGDGAGNLTGVQGLPWVICRLAGDVSRRVEAYNGTRLVPANDMSVTLVKRYKKNRVVRYELEALANDVPYPNYDPSNQGSQGNHALSHTLNQDGTGGWDTVYSNPRMLTPLRICASVTPDLNVQVIAGWYSINGAMYYFPGGSVGPFTVPGAGIEYAGVYIDATAALSIEYNVIDTGASPMTWTMFAGRAPIGSVQLVAGQTVIVENDLSQDPRFLWWTDAGGGGSCEPVTNGDLVSPEIVFSAGDVVMSC